MVDEIQKETTFLFELVKEQYGDRLSTKEIEEVKKGIESIVKASGALRSIRLKNSDEPFSIFKPHTKEV